MRKTFEARSCVECIFMASADLSHEEAEPIQVVADIASKKIDEAIALLHEYCESDAGPAPAPPAAKPVSPVSRTNRRSK